MTKITLFLNGTKISVTQLEPGREYILGRSSTADILLDNNEMSRNHAKLSFDGQNWSCQILSRYGRMVVNGVGVESLSLVSGATFQIPPFELKFEAPEPDRVTSNPSVSSSPGPASSNAGFEDLSDKTQTGQVNLKAVLYRLDENGNPVEELSLGEGLIEAGRSRSCQIKLGDEKASRKHFKMENDGRNIILTDLGSPNLTYVNGEPTKKRKLESGDEIRVGEEKFRFEFVDPNFENLPVVASEIPVQLEVSDVVVEGTEPAVIKYTPDQMPALWSQNLPANPPGGSPDKYVGYLSDHHQRFGKRSTNPMFTAVVFGIIAFIVYLALSDDPQKTDADRKVAGSADGQNQAQGSHDKYTPEQKKFLDDTYNLAMSLYTTGKYDLAALEIDKILRIDPNYKDAKNIQAFAQQALEIRKQKEEADRRQQEQEVIAHKVNDILDDCDKLLSAHRYTDVEGCVGRISDMDPENPRGQNLVLAAKEEIEKKEEDQAHRASVIRHKNEAREIFNLAQKELSEKRYPAAIGTFQKVETMAFVDTEGLKAKAKIGVQTAKQKIVDASDAIFREGKTALDAKDYKKGILKMVEALKVYPQNGDAKLSKEKAETELHIAMKEIYSESVIDENIGNVEPAKKKWKQILDTDVPFDDYYQKAKMKLGKYER